MNARTTNSKSDSGDRVAERAARSAMAQFRAAASKGAAPASCRPSGARLNARRDIRRPASEPQILRRWAVTDLIADAIRRSAFA
jgi:hypothetical protein